MLSAMLTDTDMRHLRRCVELATAALEAGDEPFGSVLVGADGTVLGEDHNHVAGGDRTQHPEFALARWAAENMTPEARAAATVYTSGEHCPMCAAAHGWVGLGRIVYVSSSEQLAEWLSDLGVRPRRCARCRSRRSCRTRWWKGRWTNSPSRSTRCTGASTPRGPLGQTRDSPRNRGLTPASLAGDVAIGGGGESREPNGDVQDDLNAVIPFGSSYRVRFQDNGEPSKFLGYVMCSDSARPFK